jgi:hypothetical protein
MTRTPNSSAQPTLAELMVRFLATRSDAAAAAVEPAEGEVEPYEVAAGFRVDPRAAWTDALVGLNPTAGSPKTPLPADWASVVAQPTPACAVAMAAGNFPQRVRDLQPLLARFNPAELRPSGHPVPSQGLSGLRTWIVRETKKRQPQSSLLAAGVARVIGETEWAEELLNDAEPLCGGDLRAAWENERAALLWESGRCEEALAAWDRLPETPAVVFNRGMANLFLGNSKEARAALARAVEMVPEENGWNALARLYQTVAEIHG